MHTIPTTGGMKKLALLAMLASPMTAALATDGYFSHGYGMKAKGMGGASVAMTDNAFAGANNPAIAAWAGDRVEAGVDVFMPDRSMERTGLGATKSDSSTFYIPEFAYNKKLSEQLGVGITVYGNGGMNTDYPANSIPANGCGAGAPTWICSNSSLPQRLPTNSMATIPLAYHPCWYSRFSKSTVCRHLADKVHHNKT